MTGTINLENFAEIKLPQKAASAWSVVENLVGATYKPILYVGSQLVNGTNFWFIAEQTLVTANPTRRLVKLAINECNGVTAILPYSIEEIF